MFKPRGIYTISWARAGGGVVRGNSIKMVLPPFYMCLLQKGTGCVVKQAGSHESYLPCTAWLKTNTCSQSLKDFSSPTK